MKTAMIWGAAGGIGQALVETLTASQWQVVAFARNVTEISKKASFALEADFDDQFSVVRPGAVDTPFWEKVPFRLPKDAAPADKVARKIVQAHDEGHMGQLDLV